MIKELNEKTPERGPSQTESRASNEVAPLKKDAKEEKQPKMNQPEVTPLREEAKETPAPLTVQNNDQK